MHPDAQHPDPQHPDSGSALSATGRTLGWGVISTGAIARKVAPEIAALQDARLVAVSSRTAQSAQAFAQQIGVERAYGGADGMDRLLADPEVEVVYIATPHGQHREHIAAALEAGKHVVCEKALTMTAQEAREVIELARARGLLLMEGLWTRFLPLTRRVAQVLASGEIGTPRWVQADLGFRGPQDSEHRLWRQDAGGGALLDMGCYALHWPWLALGEPTGVSARTVLRGPVDELTQFTADFRDGAAQMTVSLASQGPRRAVISGEQGFLEIGSPLNRPSSFAVTDRDGVRREETVPPEGLGYVHEMREATRCIQQGLLESPHMPWADSILQMELLDQIRQQIGVRYPDHDGPAPTA